MPRLARAQIMVVLCHADNFIIAIYESYAILNLLISLESSCFLKIKIKHINAKEIQYFQYNRACIYGIYIPTNLQTDN